MYQDNSLMPKTFNAINLFHFLHITNYIQFYEWACSQNYICPVNLNMQKYLHYPLDVVSKSKYRITRGKG